MHAEANQGSGMTAGPHDYGEIYLTARSAGGRESIRYSTTTIDAGAEVHVMTGALELERAIRLRGVPIAPHAVGALIVVGPNVSLWALVRGWLRERKRAQAAITWRAS